MGLNIRAWNDSERLRAAGMLREGLSASQMGSRFALTRNAIIGRVSRDDALHAIGFKASPGPRIKSEARVPTTKLVRDHKPQPAHKFTHNPLPKKEKPLVIPAVIVCREITLMELQRGDCRWPTNTPEPFEGFLFCGSPVDEGRSYCPGHYLISVGRGTESERSAIRWLQKAAA